MLYVHVNTNYINIPPIHIAAGNHALTFYLFKHDNKNYVYYKCTIRLNDLTKNKSLKLKKLFKVPVIFMPAKQIQNQTGKKVKGKPILMLKNVAYETIVDLLNYCLV